MNEYMRIKLFHIIKQKLIYRWRSLYLSVRQEDPINLNYLYNKNITKFDWGDLDLKNNLHF